MAASKYDIFNKGSSILGKGYSNPDIKTFSTIADTIKRPVSVKVTNNSYTPKPEMLMSGDYSGIISSVLGKAPTSGGGGASGINLNPLINTYKQGAEAQKSVIANESKSKRENLLTTIKRLQEDTATGRKSQQDIYQSSRSDLEDTAFMNNRAVRASAAARGLGASGLQSLAMLKNEIEANNEISNLANVNINKQGELTRSLTRGTEDANTNIQSALTEEALKLRGVDAETAQTIAAVQLQEQQRLAAARQAAAASAASASNSYNSNKTALIGAIQDAQSSAKSTVDEFINQYNAAKKSKKAGIKTQFITELNNVKKTSGSILPDSDIKMLTKYIQNYGN